MNPPSTPTPSLLYPNSKHPPTHPAGRVPNTVPEACCFPQRAIITPSARRAGERHTVACPLMSQCNSTPCYINTSTASCHITTAMTSLMKEAGGKRLVGALLRQHLSNKGEGNHRHKYKLKHCTTGAVHFCTESTFFTDVPQQAHDGPSIGQMSSSIFTIKLKSCVQQN